MKKLLLLLPLVLLLVSCKSTSKLEHLSANSDSSWEGDSTYQVIVTGKFFNPQLRKFYETEMARALLTEGVRATTSFSIFPDLNSLTSKSVQGLMRMRPDIAFLFTDANTVNQSQQTSDQNAESIFSRLRGGTGIDWETRYHVILQSSLYIYGQESAVWWSRVRLSVDESDGLTAIQDLVQLEIKEMEEAGVLERLK